jgi:hypothetical protein
MDPDLRCRALLLEVWAVRNRVFVARGGGIRVFVEGEYVVEHQVFRRRSLERWRYAPERRRPERRAHGVMKDRLSNIRRTTPNRTARNAAFGTKAGQYINGSVNVVANGSLDAGGEPPWADIGPRNKSLPDELCEQGAPR